LFKGFSIGHWKDEKIRRWLKEFPKPKTKACSRVTTVHGDYHLINMLKTDDK